MRLGLSRHSREHAERNHDSLVEQLATEAQRRSDAEHALNSVSEYVWKRMAENNSDKVSGVDIVNFIRAIQ